MYNIDNFVAIFFVLSITTIALFTIEGSNFL